MPKPGSVKRKEKKRLMKKMSQSRFLSNIHCISDLMECGRIDTYHRFEVLKKGDAEKSIIFHALEDMCMHDRCDNEDSSSTSSDILEERYSPKAKMMCHGESAILAG